MKSILALFTFCLAIFATTHAEEKPLTLDWENLLPEGEMDYLDQMASQAMPMFGHSAYGDEYGGMPVQTGTFNVVEDLDGKLVRLPGFVLPFEYSNSGKIAEFLLVPYFGACIHVPPPPPNQMVYVKAEKPVDIGKVWDAVWIVGVLRTQQHLNEIGDAAYTLELKSWEIYE